MLNTVSGNTSDLFQSLKTATSSGGDIPSLSSLLVLDIDGEHPIFCSPGGCSIVNIPVICSRRDAPLQPPHYLFVKGKLCFKSPTICSPLLCKPPMNCSMEGCSFASPHYFFAEELLSCKPSLICSSKDSLFQTHRIPDWFLWKGP